MKLACVVICLLLQACDNASQSKFVRKDELLEILVQTDQNLTTKFTNQDKEIKRLQLELKQIKRSQNE